MPLGMWLKDLLVYKRASLDVFRNWRCLLVTLYCSRCTANCKEKNNTYHTPEKKKTSEWEGHWSIFHVSFLIHIQMVSANISNMLSILLCASLSVFFFFLVITVIISVNECVGSVCKWCIIDMCGWECFVVSIQSHNPNPTTEKIIITHKIKNLPWGKSGRLFCWTKNYWKGKILNT